MVNQIWQFIEVQFQSYLSGNVPIWEDTWKSAILEECEYSAIGVNTFGKPKVPKLIIVILES